MNGGQKAVCCRQTDKGQSGLAFASFAIRGFSRTETTAARSVA